MNTIYESTSIKSVNTNNAYGLSQFQQQSLLSSHNQSEFTNIIKRHQDSAGWTMLIAPQSIPNKRTFIAQQVKLDKVLIVHKAHCKDAFIACYKAIKNNNCACIILGSDIQKNMSEGEKRCLQQQANEFGTALYFLKAELPSNYELH